MTAVTATAVTVTEAGVYQLTDEEYHADPVPGGSLSCSGAKKLLPPHCPAVFAYEREHGRPDTRAFDFGHAAHKLVLGIGPKIVVVFAENWRTNVAKEQQAAIHANGGVPLLTAEHETVQAMSAGLRAHPIAVALLRDGTGTPEASLFWTDEPSGVMRRARLDWLPDPDRPGRMIITDYKTARSAEPGTFAGSAAAYGYHQQAAWYLDGVIALGLADDPAFVFVVQEKTPPYLVTVVELDVVAVRIGRLLNRRAIDLYAECTRTDRWPGYASDVVLAPLPAWYERRYEEELS